MSKNLVKKSLYKFLNDNLDYYITYDSNDSNLKSISDLVVNSDYIYVAPNPIDEFELYMQGVKFEADDLVGRYVYVYDEVDTLLGSDLIVAIDAITKSISIKNGFNFDILTSYKIVILQESLIYIKSPYTIINNRTRLHSLGHRDRWDLIVKVKEDGNKEKIDKMLQDIRDCIFNNYSSFDIYNDLLVIVGSCRIDEKSYSENEIMDIGEDIQSFLVSFVAEYFIKYK